LVLPSIDPLVLRRQLIAWMRLHVLHVLRLPVGLHCRHRMHLALCVDIGYGARRLLVPLCRVRVAWDEDELRLPGHANARRGGHYCVWHDGILMLLPSALDKVAARCSALARNDRHLPLIRLGDKMLLLEILLLLLQSALRVLADDLTVRHLCGGLHRGSTTWVLILLGCGR